MPIANRSIKPVFVSQVKVPTTVNNEFDYIVNATLSNLIIQISCLSLKANDIFGELVSSLSKFTERTEALDAKIQNINENIEKLDTTILNPLVNQKVSIYWSCIDRDDDLLDHTHMPDCIKEMFDDANAPPELYQFDQYRKKEEESMRFYTDPDFFLREWLKNARNERKKKKEKNKNQKSKNLRLKHTQLPLPPPIIIDTIVQEPILDNGTLDYNFGDVAVYEDPTMFNISKNTNKRKDSTNYDSKVATGGFEMPTHPIPPPPPPPPPPQIMANFPTCLPPNPPPPPQPLKTALPVTKNLFADIQKGMVLKPVCAREEIKENTDNKENTGNFRELINVIRAAWINESDDSDESDC